MEIYVVTSAGDSVTLDVERTDSIENVKQKLQDRRDIPPARQTLVYEGTVLQDGQTLSDYDIEKESTLQLYVALTVATYEALALNVPPGAGEQLCFVGAGWALGQRVDVPGPGPYDLSFWSSGTLNWTVNGYDDDEFVLTLASAVAASPNVMAETAARIDVPDGVTVLRVEFLGVEPVAVADVGAAQASADLPALDLVSLRTQGTTPTTSTPAPTTTTAPRPDGSSGTPATPRFTG